MLEAAWLTLTRVTLPALAAARGWPVSADHCFQRILLDHAVGGCWYDHVAGRPAYRHLDAERLAAAVALGERVVTGCADLPALNRQSLAWRGKLHPPGPAAAAALPPSPDMRGNQLGTAGRKRVKVAKPPRVPGTI